LSSESLGSLWCFSACYLPGHLVLNNIFLTTRVKIGVHEHLTQCGKTSV
jgi:hypothetical protein